MKIAICSINFSPELTGIGKYSGEMAEWLCKRGHEVRVITAPPHYPHWIVDAEHSSWRFKREYVFVEPGERQMEVFRCPLWVPRVPRAWKRVLHLLSFSASTWPVVLKTVFWRPDVILLIAPTLFCAPQILCAARLSGAVSWLHVQDFELDAAFQLSDFSSSALRSVSERLERAVMKNFVRASSISQKMLDRLVSKGVESSRCIFFPNWVDTSAVYPMEAPVVFKCELGIPAHKTVVLYSGSFGRKQGIDFVLEVIRQMAVDSNIQFVLCGDGPTKESLSRLTAHLPNLTFLPLQPLSRLNELLNVADIHILPQRACAADLVMPSKLTGIMASGRAVLATAEPGTELFGVLQGKGIVVPPGDVEAFVTALSRLAGDPELRSRLGQKAREYAVVQLEREVILSQFESDLMEASESRSSKVHQPLGSIDNLDTQSVRKDRVLIANDVHHDY